jgi:acetylornithine deacetylase
MPDPGAEVTSLAAAFIAIDSRSFVSNLPLSEAVESALGDFEVERLDYTDAEGVAKRALVAHRGPPGGLAFSAHMDTVPDTGWRNNPFAGRIADGKLYGLGSADMKGPLAAIVLAARSLPENLPATLLITTDEETTKAGAQQIVKHSALARRAAPRGIVVAEPTELVPVRGHRSNIEFVAESMGVQAHSSTGTGRNANWALIPFLVEMRALHARLHDDPALQDPAYDPPFSDFNLVIDNHGSALNVTVPRATARIKFRYSASIDPTPVREAVREAAARSGLALREAAQGPPPELPQSHRLVRLCAEVTGMAARTVPYGTDASELQAIAPCLVLGPGDIGVAHAPDEAIPLAELTKAVGLFDRLARAFAAGMDV